jgi:hypothetical protein
MSLFNIREKYPGEASTIFTHLVLYSLTGGNTRRLTVTIPLPQALPSIQSRGAGIKTVGTEERHDFKIAVGT